MWTDILQAIAAAIAIPSAIIAFIVLFRKDKSKQDQIDRLAGISEHLEAQNTIMKEANELMAQQVDALRNIALGGTAETNRLAEIEERKLKLKYRPFFKHRVGSSQQTEFTWKLMNHGARASIVGVEHGEDILHARAAPTTIENGGLVKVTGRGRDSASTRGLKFTLVYQDEFGTEYEQSVSGSQVGPPVERVKE